jgi:hypothetical protein
MTKLLSMAAGALAVVAASADNHPGGGGGGGNGNGGNGNGNGGNGHGGNGHGGNGHGDNGHGDKGRGGYEGNFGRHGGYEMGEWPPAPAAPAAPADLPPPLPSPRVPAGQYGGGGRCGTRCSPWDLVSGAPGRAPSPRRRASPPPRRRPRPAPPAFPRVPPQTELAARNAAQGALEASIQQWCVRAHARVPRARAPAVV